VKKRILALVGLSLAAGLSALAQPLAAPATQSAANPPSAMHAPPTKVGVIQAQSALLGTKDGQRAVQELNKRLEPTKAALDKKATAIRELQDKLQRGGNAMADAAKVELNRNIEQLTKAYNRDMEDAQAEGEQEQHKLMDELTTKITKVIDSFAQANGYSLILDVSNPNTPVLYAANSVDITPEIIALYDKTYPVASVPTQAKPTPPASTPPVKPATTAPVTPKKQP
jgi:outer membrane protein